MIETFGSLSPSGGFTNAVTEVVVGDGSVLEHIRLQRESNSAFHIGHTAFHLGRSSRSSSHAFAFGGRISRHDAVAVLGDEGADCTLNGFYLAGGNQLIDNHTEDRPRQATRRGPPALQGHPRRAGPRRVRRPDSRPPRTRRRPTRNKRTRRCCSRTRRKSTPSPSSRSSPTTFRCTHGATVGQLSQDALFYLRTRGIGLDDARSLLVRAFAADVTGRVALEPLRADSTACSLPGCQPCWERRCPDTADPVLALVLRPRIIDAVCSV